MDATQTGHTSCRHRRPQLFSDERHLRMKEPQRCIKHRAQHLLLRSVGLHGGLDCFQIPITHLAPHKVIGGVSGIVETVSRKGAFVGCQRVRKPRNNPSINQRPSGRINGWVTSDRRQVAKCKSRCIPDLIGEISANVKAGAGVQGQWRISTRRCLAGRCAVCTGDLLGRILGRNLHGISHRVAGRIRNGARREHFTRPRINHVHRHANILRVSGHLHQRESHGISAVRLNDVARVNTVTQRLGHLLAEAILHHGMNEHMLERNSPAKEIAIEHHHAAHPQRDDFTSRRKYCAGVPLL